MKSYKKIPVQIKPWFLNANPFNQSRGTAFANKIYLRQDVFENFLSPKPSIVTISLLEHEKTHIDRSAQQGGLLFYFRYWLSKSFRLTEELEAIKSEMKVIKQHKEEFEIQKRAKYLSSYYYLWCTSFDDVQNKLQNIWHSI